MGVQFRGLSEAQEGTDLASWLDARDVLYTHVPSGGLRSGREGASFKRQGLKPGCPDYLLFTLPAALLTGAAVDPTGVAVELKRANGKAPEAHQLAFHARLRVDGWIVLVAYGADDAIKQLSALGY